MSPLSPDVVAANLRILAERLHWPAGAVEAVEAVQAEHPGWRVWWQPATSRRAEGWYAMHEYHTHLEPDMYGATPDALREAIAGHRCAALNPPSDWSWI